MEAEAKPSSECSHGGWEKARGDFQNSLHVMLISRVQMVLAARITKYLKMPIMPHSSWQDVAELLFH